MKVNTYLLIASFLVLTFVCFGQSENPSIDRANERRIKMQILVHDLENRIREVNFSAPRVMARYRIAAWLWKDGKDVIGRAEELAVMAVEDMFKNRSEIPEVYFNSLSSDLFSLLDRNSPRVSKSLKEKYKFNAEAGVRESLLDQPGGEKAAVDSAIRSINSGDVSDSEISSLLFRLEQRNSPERYRLMDAVIAAEERIRGRLTSATFRFISSYISGREVPPGTSRRFAGLVVARARDASQMQFGDIDIWVDILAFNMPLIRERYPELVNESNVVHAVLLARISQKSRDMRERNERINSSSDKLGALISEAEKTEDPLAKYELYRSAANLALERGKFVQAADLAHKFGSVDVSAEPIIAQGQRVEVDQLLEKITDRALKVEDVRSAIYAVERTSDNYRRADGFGKVAKFYLKKGDRDSARTTIGLAANSASYVEDLAKRASIYLKLIPVYQGIDPTSVFEINTLAAKAVNAIPTLNIEDKPDTENYKNHVAKMMGISWNLLPSLTNYVKTDRNGAADLVGRIEPNEVKIFGDFVLGVASIEIDGLIEIEPESTKTKS